MTAMVQMIMEDFKEINATNWFKVLIFSHEIKVIAQ
jgi:hypothetical protein